MHWSASPQSSEFESDWVFEEPTPPQEPKEHECLKPGTSPRAVAPEPTGVDGGLPPRVAAPKLGLDKTVDLLSQVPGAGNEDPDLSALSAAHKTKLGLSDLTKPPPTMCPAVEPLTRDVKSCRGIRRSPMDPCPSPFHPRVRTVPVCTVGDTTEAEMKSYGLAALAPLAITHPSPPSGRTADPGVPGRGTKAIATAKLRIGLVHEVGGSLSPFSMCRYWGSVGRLLGPSSSSFCAQSAGIPGFPGCICLRIMLVGGLWAGYPTGGVRCYRGGRRPRPGVVTRVRGSIVMGTLVQGRVRLWVRVVT